MTNDAQKQLICSTFDEAMDTIRKMNFSFLQFRYPLDAELSLMTTHLIGLMHRYKGKLLTMEENFENGWPATNLPLVKMEKEGESV